MNNMDEAKYTNVDWERYAFNGKIPSMVTRHVTRGLVAERLIRQWYERTTGNLVREVGFATSRRWPQLGASLDGIVNEELFIEIKCIDKVDSSITPDVSEASREVSRPDFGIKPEHYLQIQFAGGITGMKECDYIVTCMASGKTHIRRVKIDHDYFASRMVPRALQYCDRMA